MICCEISGGSWKDGKTGVLQMILPTFIQKYFEYQEIYATLILHDKIKESGDCSMGGLFRALHRTKVFRNLTEQEFAWVLYDVGNSAFIMQIGRASCRERV